jgi:hypothetical protein
MFETEDFKSRIDAAVSAEAARNGLTRYQKSQIVEYLQNLAVTNEKTLMESELKKSVGRRGVSDAVESAVTLTREASRYASLQKRDLLMLEDIQTAYKVKFCQVWPFCK